MKIGRCKVAVLGIVDERNSRSLGLFDYFERRGQILKRIVIL